MSCSSDENLGILTNEENLFFKILLKNIDPNTGEFITISQQSLSVLHELYHKCINLKPTIVYKTYNLSKEEQEIIDEYVSGQSLSYLLSKYKLPSKKVKNILKKAGIAKNKFLICSTYQETLKKIESNKDFENVGTKWTEEEDSQLIAEYTNGISVMEISKIHKRKPSGIKARLVKHGFAEHRNKISNVFKNFNEII